VNGKVYATKNAVDLLPTQGISFPGHTAVEKLKEHLSRHGFDRPPAHPKVEECYVCLSLVMQVMEQTKEAAGGVRD